MTGRKNILNQRLSRTQYVVRICLTLVAAFVVLFFTGGGLNHRVELLQKTPNVILLAVCAVVIAVLMVRWTMQRLRDFEEPGWKWVFLIIPILNIFWLIILLTTDGTVGDNKYGADPRHRLPFYVDTPRA
ncbi:MAG: DUF805 domain-containing protein [Bacteroidales bacterium]|nr:DUF805 domain-containing protein [Bacteroidales bacterium]